MAMPANNIVVTEVPKLEVATRYTTNVVITPPINAPKATIDSPAKGESIAPPAATITILAPTEAPPDTPISDGSANGLRNKPCITAPKIARTAPTNRARISRGKRISIIIL